MERRNIKIIFFGLSALGLLYLAFGFAQINSGRKDMIIFNLLFGAGAFILGFIGYIFLKLTDKKAEMKRMEKAFDVLMYEYNGKISIQDFAIEAGVDKIKAKEYIEKKAVKFSAKPEFTENEGIFYRFAPDKLKYFTQQ